ncbi:calcium/sodium antiporter [Patescibacteria group bacterium]|nr:calcium/sodium antiporter [Candidatus Falkowbacteria bacterium]MBU3905867.1 calcium/sodium antiporter [Patescibacteria group bacterium]MBU4015472.1 calcium/sodium antiporter [Patescibacteria group bacterium]MBU4026414.1 calcium/sodium antiporter [Patescibacteria group bacterium]MBU4072687.1 calcium/sodium antiporter [Patescibacteria group bacterium]
MALIGLFLAMLISFYLLARVCDEYFVESLDKIAKKLKMSSDAAGATLMAIGSSAPELFVAAIALLKPGDHAALGMGTIVGSALFNILVIVGAAAIVKKAVLSWQPVVRDMMFYSLSIIMLIVAFRDGQVDIKEAGMFIVLYLIYIIAVIKWRKILPYKDVDVIKELEEKMKKSKENGWKKIVQPLNFVLDKLFPSAEHYYSVFFISIAVIAGLSWVLVESAVAISHILRIPEVIIALTVLAAGTSIPDMISSIIVAKQGRGCMAISNAIGSNIFDILICLGLPWLIVLSFSGGTIGVSTENLLSSVVLLFATVLVIFFLLLARKWKIGHRAGWFLIGLYAAYVVWAISAL